LNKLVFVKLGGSLITNKTQPMTVRQDVLALCVAQVASAFNSGVRLLVGHGSGSFGHYVAQQYGTRMGVRGAGGWYGYAQVGMAARQLDQIFVGALLKAGLPAVSVPPSASAVARAGELVAMDQRVITSLLHSGALPVVLGDVAIDEEWGGTILSTEQVFAFLAPRLEPTRIVLAGEVEGVYSADPADVGEALLYRYITPENFHEVARHLGRARGADVTGGMLDKVRRMYALAMASPGLEIQIVNGKVPGLLERAILGEAKGEGTTIRVNATLNREQGRNL